PVSLAVTVTAPAAAAAKVSDRRSPEALPTPARAAKGYPLIRIGPYAGYFRPRDAVFKEIYGEGDALYGARLAAHIWQGFYFWFSASQYRVISSTTFTEDKTTLTLLPISVFLRYNLGRGFFIPYAGIGYTFLSFKEESEFLPDVRGNGSNFAFEAGIELKMNRHLSFDLGGRFSQIRVQPEDSDKEIDLGGLQAGISLLVSF
ncbi:MAG: outer membrane beta-barrel protein, partial [Candidatus Aminicenantes bacterium]|nr:outer membrane beta-barrel protein [Candidatus Aminicenantes bacterium]